MKCKQCGEEFDSAKLEHNKVTVEKDGKEVNISTYSYDPICPNCGHDNSPNAFW